jgi:hypothetical protein
MTTNLIPSLFTCHRPVERYWELCAATSPAGDAGPSAVDSFVLTQVPDAYASAPLVLDLAADATGGATVALWASHPRVRHVLAPPGGTADGDWRETFPAVAAEMGISPERFRLDDDAGGPLPRNPPRRSVLINLAVPPDDAADAKRLVADVLDRYPGSLVLLSPLGPTGASPSLEAALAVCAADPAYRLALFREVSPFLAASRLGLIHPARSPEADAVLDRVRRAFGGNFQFLGLLRTVSEQAARLAAVEDAGGRRMGAASRRLDPDDYAQLIGRVRRVVDEVLPTGAAVLVVSKGDERLLELGDRRGLHFPQTPDGTYAGHHPADGPAAVRHLRALRAKGADYLLVPAPFFWWLDHYAELRAYAETTGRVVTCRPDCCVVYDLRPRRRPDRTAIKARRRQNGG